MLHLSACIVNYNNAPEIQEAVRSIILKTQRYSLTLYISDNGSQDSSLKDIEAEFSDVQIIRNNSNDGFGAAHNKVLDEIKSDYHFIINPDIIIESDVLSDMADFMRENEDVAIAVPKILNTDGSEQVLPKKNPKLKYLIARRVPGFSKLEKKYTMADTELGEITDIEFCTGCFICIKSDIFKVLEGFDDRFFMYFEDADLTRRAVKLGRAVRVSTISVIHKWERAGAKKLKFLLIQISSMLKYMKKWK